VNGQKSHWMPRAEEKETTLARAALKDAPGGQIWGVVVFEAQDLLSRWHWIQGHIYRQKRFKGMKRPL
jgi:hypothetical protein